jgi:hypothetical protein
LQISVQGSEWQKELVNRTKGEKNMEQAKVYWSARNLWDWWNPFGNHHFVLIRTPRPPGAYQIKFVEIARSNGTPVLLARLFLNVE